jgi:hypothetical protein
VACEAQRYKSTQIEEFQFDPTRFDRHTLFKLPKRAGLLTVDGLGRADPEFKALVENGGLTGLKFEEIWSESGPPIQVKTLN